MWGQFEWLLEKIADQPGGWLFSRYNSVPSTKYSTVLCKQEQEQEQYAIPRPAGFDIFSIARLG